MGSIGEKYIDGRTVEELDFSQWDGFHAPPVAPLNCARVYFDNLVEQLLLSQNYGSYQPFVTGTVDLSAYWKSDGTSTATGNWDLGLHSFSAQTIVATDAKLTLGLIGFGGGFKFTPTTSSEQFYVAVDTISTSGAIGGSLNIKGGKGDTAGGSIIIEGGEGNGLGNTAGAVFITGGYNTVGSYNDGQVNIEGGNPATGNGGDVNIYGGFAGSNPGDLYGRVRIGGPVDFTGIFGDIDFGSNKLTTTGTLGAGAITGTGLKILEGGATPTLYGIFSVADLSTADKTYTFPNRSLTIDNLTTSSTTNLTGFIKGNGSVLSADNSTYYKSGDSPSFTTLTHTGIKEKYRLITSADSLVATDDFVAVTGTTTITLPTAVGIQGTVYTIKNTGTAIVTIATTSSQTIDGVTTYVIRTTNSGVQIISDNANWLVKGVF